MSLVRRTPHERRRWESAQRIYRDGCCRLTTDELSDVIRCCDDEHPGDLDDFAQIAREELAKRGA